MSANAVPITFTFDMPAFTNGALAGEVSVLDVTVDNGGTSALNQAFLNTQITSLSTEWTGAITPVYGGSNTVVTTDAQGLATLNFTNAAVYAYGTYPNYIQLRSSRYQYYVRSGSGQAGWLERNDNFPIVSRAAEVAEPGTLALLAAGIGFMYRRKTVGGRV